MQAPTILAPNSGSCLARATLAVLAYAAGRQGPVSGQATHCQVPKSCALETFTSWLEIVTLKIGENWDSHHLGHVAE